MVGGYVHTWEHGMRGGMVVSGGHARGVSGRCAW